MQFKTEILQPCQWQDILPLVKDSFCTGEPVTLSCHATPDEMVKFLSPGIKDWVSSGLSIAARDNCGNIVGLMLSKIITRDSAQTFSALTEETSNEVKLFRKVLENLECTVDAFKSDTSITKVLELALLTVTEKYRGQNLGLRLSQESESLGIKAGCQRGLVQATNTATQVIFKKMGYTTDYVLKYQDYEVEGKKVLDVEATKGSVDAWVMSKDFIKRAQEE